MARLASTFDERSQTGADDAIAALAEGVHGIARELSFSRHGRAVAHRSGSLLFDLNQACANARG